MNFQIAEWGSHVAELGRYRDCLHPEDRATALPALDAAVAAGEPYCLRFRIVTPEGQVQLLEARAERMVDAGGSPSQLIGVVHDISELAKAQADLEQFVFAASHDLKEPLRTVTNFTQLLARSVAGQSGKDAEQYIEFILDGTKRMRALVEGLLELSRAGSGPNKAMTPVDCERMIAACGVAVVHGKLPVVEGDPARLAKLFHHLISNAVQYRRREVEPRIEITAEHVDSRMWRFCIRDNGQGFDPVHAEAVFAPFRKLHGHGVSGSGLGLAICRRIVESHGGTIWAEAAPGEGAAFYFTLPGKIDTAAPAPRGL